MNNFILFFIFISVMIVSLLLYLLVIRSMALSPRQDMLTVDPLNLEKVMVMIKAIFMIKVLVMIKVMIHNQDHCHSHG